MTVSGPPPSDPALPVVLVSVIIVNYCSGEMVADAVAALEMCDRTEVLVVDNASTDGSMAILEGMNSNAHLIYNTQNLGFAKAVNIGARHASGRFLCLLNPDTDISGESLLALTELIDADKNLGVVAPLICHPSGIRVLEAGWEPDVWRLLMHVSGLSRFANISRIFRGFHARRSQVGNDFLSLDWVSGALLVTRADTWKALGGLDERWFMYTEDIEFCRRVRKLGQKVGIAGWVLAHHSVGSSVNKSAIDAEEALARDQRPTDTLWVTSLYEYYRDELARSRPAVTIWTLVLLVGLVSRMLAFRVLAACTADELAATRYGFLSRKFGWSVRALLRKVGGCWD
ncbi:glycosyltransferase [Gordonia sp. p3-SID1431]|uniref:glycosyltransferase family 2 protein n=1 Tax=Gordonia sp. p3-SID1431 TaxID=2916159 RepID=UPI0037BFA24C